MHANKMAQSHPLTYVSIYYSEKTSTLLNEPKRDFSSLPLKSLRLFGAILSKRRRSPPSISPEIARVHYTLHLTSLLFASVVFFFFNCQQSRPTQIKAKMLPANGYPSNLKSARFTFFLQQFCLEDSGFFGS